MEDMQIIDLYWARVPRAIAQSRDKYGGYCFTVANHILDSYEDSEGCVNDTWLHAWNAMPPHRPGVLRMFLAKITRRVAFNRFKASTAWKRGGGGDFLCTHPFQACTITVSDNLGGTVMRQKARILTAGHIRRYAAHLRDQERSAATIQKYTHDLTALLA